MQSKILNIGISTLKVNVNSFLWLAVNDRHNIRLWLAV